MRVSTAGPQEDSSKALNIGVAAHITAASPGGPRYDPNLTPDQRRSTSNGVWLCQNCAKLVDNDDVCYPGDVLRAWKTLREHYAKLSIGQTRQPAMESEIARRGREISKYVGQRVMLVKMPNSHQATTLGSRPWVGNLVALMECTDFYVKVRGDGWDRARTIPLENIKIGHDDRHNCIELLEYD